MDKQNKQKIEVIIAGGGTGTRLGHTIPKQFIKINGKAMILYSVETFASYKYKDKKDKDNNKDNKDKDICGITVVVPQDWTVATNDVLSNSDIVCNYRSKGFRVDIINGGETRQKSVFMGLCHVKIHQPDIILIHDAARPFISDTKINELIAELQLCSAAVLCTSVKDTVKVCKNTSNGDLVAHETLNRERLFFAQTPQAFAFDTIYKAHKKANDDGFVGTDDCSLTERLGICPKIIEGDSHNVKITTSDDLIYAEFLASLYKAR